MQLYICILTLDTSDGEGNKRIRISESKVMLSDGSSCLFRSKVNLLCDSLLINSVRARKRIRIPHVLSFDPHRNAKQNIYEKSPLMIEVAKKKAERSYSFVRSFEHLALKEEPPSCEQVLTISSSFLPQSTRSFQVALLLFDCINKFYEIPDSASSLAS